MIKGETLSSSSSSVLKMNSLTTMTSYILWLEHCKKEIKINIIFHKSWIRIRINEFISSTGLNISIVITYCLRSVNVSRGGKKRFCDSYTVSFVT